jgi:hypothetical protein
VSQASKEGTVYVVDDPLDALILFWGSNQSCNSALSVLSVTRTDAC